MQDNVDINNLSHVDINNMSLSDLQLMKGAIQAKDLSPSLQTVASCRQQWPPYTTHGIPYNPMHSSSGETENWSMKDTLLLTA